jgi:hypothetical protein
VSGCAAVQEELPELALGVLDGSTRAEVVDHLAGCARCRVVAEGHAATADALALAVPEAEPPPGFLERTQVRLGRERGPQRRRRPRQVGFLVGAAAALLVIATLAAVRIVDASNEGEPGSGRVHEARMIGDGDHGVGHVYATEADGQDFLFVSVAYGVPAGTYAVDVVGDDGAVRVGTMAIADGRGHWAGPTGGVRGPPRRVQLVDDGGRIVCRAEFAT